MGKRKVRQESLFCPVIEEHTETNTVYYVREPGGELIARVHPTEGIRYYHFDELGSTRLLTDVNGTVTDRYAYDAYGSLLAHDRYTGSVDQPYQYVGQLGYYTHYQEPDFGLLQLGVRFYDAQVGRFGQRDLLPEPDESAYLYVAGASTSAVDPTGLKGERVFGDGEICVDSSCHNWCTPWVLPQVNFGGPNRRPLLAPKKGINCIDTDAIIVPPGVPVVGKGIRVPKRPPGQDRLKISGGVRCTISCRRKASTVSIWITCKRYSKLRKLPFWIPPVAWR